MREDDRLVQQLMAALAEVDELRAENARLRGLIGWSDHVAEPTEATPTTLWPTTPTVEAVDDHSPTAAKTTLYRSLFTGRQDVYATRWENLNTGKAGWSPAVRGGWTRASKGPREYLPLTEEVIGRHLDGALTAGLYPLLPGDVCCLLACDFDGSTWALDALAYLDACTTHEVPAVLERSRSGNGAHVWIFFTKPVPAASARELGAGLLREAMTRRAELDLASYDRFFPAQDYLPKGSLGNLIALPLQGGCRQRGTTVFLDPATLRPWSDQWAFLSSLPRLAADRVEKLVDELQPIHTGPGSVLLEVGKLDGPPPPAEVKAELGAMLAINRFGLPPALLAALKHLASLHNPIFYEKQQLRLSTWNTPRFIRCYQETLDRLILPRGLLPEVQQLLTEAGSRLVTTDQRTLPHPQPFTLTVTLTAQQQAAVADLASHEHGVLVAPPGTGKTVMACSLIAHHQQPTLVIVDRKPLLEQWRTRLGDHLGLASTQVGQLGSGGKDRPSGVVDVAMVQSLARRDDLETLTAGYGFVVVDECHHVPAVTFEACVKRIPVRGWVGLTATPYRRDGLQAIINLHCGPTRHHIAHTDTPGATLLRRLVIHPTDHAPPDADERPIQQVFRALVDDGRRTKAICADVLEALGRGRNCLVLTQWTQHLDHLCDGLRAGGQEPLVLKGGMGKKAHTAVIDALTSSDRRGGLLLVATGSYLGEGFDCPQLDTLFLAFPLAFKGRLVQYVGRILRATDTKQSVEVHDYVDSRVPVLERMHTKRLTAFDSLGFDTPRRSRRRKTDDGAR